MPGFSATVASPLGMEQGAPKDLPDALRGEAWQFVQLPLSDLQAELQQTEQASPPCLGPALAVSGAHFEMRSRAEIGLCVIAASRVVNLNLHSQSAAGEAGLSSHEDSSAPLPSKVRASISDSTRGRLPLMHIPTCGHCMSLSAAPSTWHEHFCMRSPAGG